MEQLLDEDVATIADEGDPGQPETRTMGKVEAAQIGLDIGGLESIEVPIEPVGRARLRAAGDSAELVLPDGKSALHPAARPLEGVSVSMDETEPGSTELGPFEVSTHKPVPIYVTFPSDPDTGDSEDLFLGRTRAFDIVQRRGDADGEVVGGATIVLVHTE